MSKRAQTASGCETAEKEGSKRRKKVRFVVAAENDRTDQVVHTEMNESIVQVNKHSSARRKKGKRKKRSQSLTKPGDPSSRKEVALHYLHLWHKDREKWCFRKKPQFWLLQNMYDKTQVINLRRTGVRDACEPCPL